MGKARKLKIHIFSFSGKENTIGQDLFRFEETKFYSNPSFRSMLKEGDFEPNQIILLESKRPEGMPLYIKEASGSKDLEITKEYLGFLGQPLFSIDENRVAHRLPTEGAPRQGFKGW